MTICFGSAGNCLFRKYGSVAEQRLRSCSRAKYARNSIPAAKGRLQTVFDAVNRLSLLLFVLFCRDSRQRASPSIKVRRDIMQVYNKRLLSGRTIWRGEFSKVIPLQ